MTREEALVSSGAGSSKLGLLVKVDDHHMLWDTVTAVAQPLSLWYQNSGLYG